MTGSLRGRAKSSRPRRQVKNARRRGFRHGENVYRDSSYLRAYKAPDIYVPIRHRFTFVESPLQIHLFLCKTNPIYWFLKMNVTSVKTRDYGNELRLRPPKNKPKQSQFKPNLRKAKMKLNFYSTRDYENKRLCRLRENKPNFKGKKEKQGWKRGSIDWSEWVYYIGSE